MLLLIATAGLLWNMALAVSSKAMSSAMFSYNSCIVDPTSANCEDFIYPTDAAQSDLEGLCAESVMRFMTPCSVYRACKTANNKKDVTDKYLHVCHPFTILTTVCRLDRMGGMPGCQGFMSMCNTTGSIVLQCLTNPGLPALPSTGATNVHVRAICEHMNMQGCSSCSLPAGDTSTWARCDVLSVYGNLCRQMPAMEQCNDWKLLCMDDPSFFVCQAPSWHSRAPAASPAGADAVPAMKMYFNTELPFYLLFKQWTPATTLSYTGSLVAVFLLAVLLHALQAFRMSSERSWARQANSSEQLDGAPRRQHALPWLPVRMRRAMLQFASVSLAYLLMLAIMSFNVGVFLTAVGGVAAGTFLFGHVHTIRRSNQRPLLDSDSEHTFE